MGEIYLTTSEAITKTVTESISDVNSSIQFESGKKYIIICELNNHSTLTKGSILYELRGYFTSGGSTVYNINNEGTIQNPFSDASSVTRQGCVGYYAPKRKEGDSFIGSRLYAKLTSSESASTVNFKVIASFFVFEIIE